MSDNQDIHIPFKQLEKRFKGVLIRLPLLAGNEAVNFSLDNFRQRGFRGQTMQPWKKRKKKTKWGKVKRPGRALLVDIGRLRRSIRLVKVTDDTAVIGSDVPYAKAHNEGFRGTVVQNVKAHTRRKFGVSKVSSIKTRKSRKVKVTEDSTQVKAHTRTIHQNIPKRQFMGKSPYLNKRIMRVATAELKKHLK